MVTCVVAKSSQATRQTWPLELRANNAVEQGEYDNGSADSECPSRVAHGEHTASDGNDDEHDSPQRDERSASVGAIVILRSGFTGGG
jgi:hypothetical protein